MSSSAASRRTHALLTSLRASLVTGLFSHASGDRAIGAAPTRDPAISLQTFAPDRLLNHP
jgi:hypothetical protein